MIPILCALLVFSKLTQKDSVPQGENVAQDFDPELERQLLQNDREVYADDTNTTIIESPASATRGNESYYSGTTIIESYYFTLVNSSTSGNNSEPSYTVLVTKKVTESYSKIEINYTELKNTPTETSPYKYIFFHPAILIGGLSGALFLIGAFYTCFCRKSTSINYSNYLKNNKANKDSDSMDDLKPSNARAAPKGPPKASTKAKQTRKHRH